MDDFTYTELREDITSLVAETESYGNSVAGGFGRAFVEYWLEPGALEDVYPTPRPMKLMAVVAIFALMKERGVEPDERNQSVIHWLADNLSIGDLTGLYSRSDIDLMLADARDALPELLANKLEAKFAAARA